MQHFLVTQILDVFNLEMYGLALAIAKKTLDENRFRNAWKTSDLHLTFKSDRMYLQNKQPVKFI